jgi:hypothetical protein
VDEQDGARDIDTAGQLAIINILDERGTFPFGYCSLIPGLGVKPSHPANIVSVTSCKADLFFRSIYDAFD